MTIPTFSPQTLLRAVNQTEGENDLPQPIEGCQLSGILPAVSDALGVPISTALYNDPRDLRMRFGFPQARAVVVVLIDGLGYWNIVQRIGHAPYLRSLINEENNSRPIRTCMPSTTVVAVSSFGTGTCPGLTCMTGYTQKHPDTVELSQLIQFRNAPDPRDLQRQPTVFESLRAKGVRADSVSLPKFEHSALTIAALRGARYMTASTPRARIMKAALSTREPGLTYLYLCELDKVGHREGWQSDQWVSVFEQIDEQLRLLRSHCSSGTMIIITADHGMVTSNPRHRIDIAEHEMLTRDVELVGGEPRSVMLYARSGVSAVSIAHRWRDFLGDQALVRTQEEAIADGVYGRVSDRARSVLGDVLVQAYEDITIVDSRIQSQQAMSLPSVHGSITHMEMDIPCLVDIVK